MKREEMLALIERFGGKAIAMRAMPTSYDMKEDSVEAVLTTEKPADVWDWEKWDIIPEVLRIDGMLLPEGREQVPLLDTHARYSISDQLGSVRGFGDSTIAGYAAKMGRFHFASTQDAQDAATKVKEGHVTDNSVGYEVLSSTWIAPGATVKVNGKEYSGGERGLRVTTQWKLKEVSLCPIGADELATIRSEAKRQETKTTIITNTQRGGVMTPEERAAKEAQEKAERAANEELAKQAEAERVKNIEAVRDTFGDRFDKIAGESGKLKRLAKDAVDLKQSDETFRAEVYEVVSKDNKPIEAQRDYLDMSRSQTTEYSIVKVIRSLLKGDALDGVELEAHKEIENRLSGERVAVGRAYYIPRDIRQRAFSLEMARRAGQMYGRTINVTNFTQGGVLVGADVRTADMVELLRNEPIVIRAGATVWSGLKGNVPVPKHTSGATMYALPETGAPTRSSHTFGRFVLSPHRISGTTDWTLEMAMQTSLDVEAFALNDLADAAVVARDYYALAGLGVNGEPLGLLNQTGTNSVTFGAAATLAKAIEFETHVRAANVRTNGRYAYVSNSTVRGKWKGIAEWTYANSGLWKGGDPGEVNGYPALDSQQIASATNKMLFGKWDDMILADWDGMMVGIDNISRFREGIFEVTIHLWIDNNIRRGVSFSISADSANQ